MVNMDKDIRTYLQELKDETGWSEPRLAKEIGVSQPTVNRILRGQGNCMGSTLRAIEEAHGRLCPQTRRKDDRQPNSST